MRPSIPKHILLAKLLDLHLTRTIARERRKDQVMSKFLELADNIEADLKEMDVEADTLNEKRLANKEAARLIFNSHHAAQDRVRDGLARMAAVTKDLSGSNSNRGETEGKKEETKPGQEGSGDTSKTFLSKAG